MNSEIPMDSDMVSWKYCDTGEPVKVGDFVNIDSYQYGRITGVYLPGTPEAGWCNCEDTGCLTFIEGEGIPMILSFGVFQTITKRAGNDTAA